MGFVFAGRSRWSSLVPLLLMLFAADVRAFAVERPRNLFKVCRPRAAFFGARLSRGDENESAGKRGRAAADPVSSREALIEQSRQSPDPATRAKLLDEARQELERFAESNRTASKGPKHNCSCHSADDPGQESVAQALQLPKVAAYEAQRKSLGHDARIMFAEARDTFGVQRRSTAPSWRSCHRRPARKRGRYRQQAAGVPVARGQVRFLTAQSRFDEARSYPPAADEFRKLNETAAQDLSTIYDEFARTMLVGLYARLYEGRCYQAIGKLQEALGALRKLSARTTCCRPSAS